MYRVRVKLNQSSRDGSIIKSEKIFTINEARAIAKAFMLGMIDLAKEWNDAIIITRKQTLHISDLRKGDINAYEYTCVFLD